MTDTYPATPPSKPSAIGFARDGVRLETIEDAFRFATAVHKSGLAPAALKSPEAILIALQSGLELGFTPMRALSAIAVVNGRPSLMGEAALAKIRQSRACTVGPELSTRGEGDERRGVISFQREGMAELVEVEFSTADAKKAGLWGKSGPWSQYPDDMLIWRATARACKRYFSDVLLGLVLTEEAQDYPTQAGVTAEILGAESRVPAIGAGGFSGTAVVTRGEVASDAELEEPEPVRAPEPDPTTEAGDPCQNGSER